METILGVEVSKITHIVLLRDGTNVAVDQTQTVTVDMSGYVIFKADGGGWFSVPLHAIEAVKFTP